MIYTVIQLIISCGLITLLIIFPGTAHEGAKNGVTLFFDSLFPYLFPYLILSNWLLAISSKIKTPKFFDIIKIYLLGSIGGFPTGAILLSNLYNEKQITKKSAELLLGICHSPNPLFVVGFVSLELLNIREFSIYYFIIINAISVILLLIFFKKIHITSTSTLQKSYNLYSNVQQSMNITLIVGGIIIFFSTFLTIILSLFHNLLPVEFLLFLSSGLEMTNGLVFIVSQSPPYLLMFIAIALTAQSFSIHLQVYLFAKNSSLSMKPYFFIRALYTGLVGIIFYALITLQIL